MQTLKEQAVQLRASQDTFYNSMSDIFDKCQDAGILREQYCNEWTALSGFTFDGYEFYTDHVEIKGQRYAGCGEYDHCQFNVPYDSLDNIDDFIAGKKAEIAEEARKKAEEEAAKEAQQKIEHEEHERELYLELKEKFDGVTQ